MRTRLLLVLLVIFPQPALAISVGIDGRSGRQGSTCNACHSGGVAPSVRFSGPAAVAPGATATFTFTVASNEEDLQIAAGFNVAADAGTLRRVLGQKSKVVRKELTHTQPKNNDIDDTASWSFKWKAPSESGVYMFWGAGNSVDRNDDTSGDKAASTTFVVAVGDVTPPPLPTPTPTSTPTVLPTVTASHTATLVATATASETPTVTSTPPFAVGDANCDGNVGAADLAELVVQIALGDTRTCGADANQDGVVAADDIAWTIESIFRGQPTVLVSPRGILGRRESLCNEPAFSTGPWASRSIGAVAS